MFFLKIILLYFFFSEHNSYPSEISTQTISVGINQSLYDFEFTNKVIEYFKMEDKRKEIYELKKEGFYRTELIFTIKFSIDKKIEISEIIKMTKKKRKSIYKIADEYGYNSKENFLKSIEIRKKIESEIDDLRKLEKIIKKEFLDEK
jgi:hypothetical protein